MPRHRTNMYDVEPHVAEVYDLTETYNDDVDLVRRLIGGRKRLRILEPFCGTGRILIPLALDGHELVGLDQAKGMLARARAKVAGLPDDVQSRVTLVEADVTRERWPQGFDLVILGGNCLYELGTTAEQERCVASAAASLIAGGYVYVDNNHMEGELDPFRQSRAVRRDAFPTGVCADGTCIESTTQAIWWDAPSRLIRYRRRTRVFSCGGDSREIEYTKQCHPVSRVEIGGWLEAHGFEVEDLFGDRAGNPYTDASSRAIFWARKP